MLLIFLNSKKRLFLRVTDVQKVTSPSFYPMENLLLHRFSDRLLKTREALTSFFIIRYPNSASLTSFIQSLQQPIENSCGELEVYHSIKIHPARFARLS